MHSLFIAEAYLHRLDPFAIQFTETFGIRWYGLSYLAGFVAGWAIIRWLARTGRCALSPADVGDFMFYLILGVIVGGRLGYCIFYDPSLFVDPPLLGVVQVWKGGMASHGGMLGVVAASWWFARTRKHSIFHLFDITALACPPGLCLGRLANFINGELWGKALPAEMQANPPWWSLKYPEEILQSPRSWEPRLSGLEGHLSDRVDTLPAAVVGALREGDEVVTEAVAPLLTAYYPSQLYQALTDGPILIAAVAAAWWFRLKPGVAGGWFLISYGILRVVTEVFRQPDPGVAVLGTPLGDLSRGQQLSLLMIGCGLAMMIGCARRRVAPLGSLRRTREPDAD